MTSSEHQANREALTLVLTARGKTGRRVADRLEARVVPIRRGSRSGEIPFEWNDPTTWEPTLAGVKAAYVVYTPDLAVPAAPPAIRDFTKLAVRSGVKNLVLLSGRGEEEAQRCERIVQDSGVDWTIVRASWFSQNFSEGPFLDLVVGGEVALPAGSVAEPFIDAGDIADVAVAALTEDGHAGQVYEVTGPRMLTFAEAIAEIAEAAGRPICYVQIPQEAFVAGLTQAGVPADYIELLKYLFTTVLDGRNEHLTDGVQRALGRAPRDFREYARDVAPTGVWNGPGQGA
ncbi:MAG: NmrA family transcriptional regulator [Planctomycetota bacterium]